ncbi:MAG TPA: hypothetical protein VK149_09285 [Sideroxyarcus sp.]|nr:hypothetical protein [Sideroxyarcus sp.]
MRFFTDHFFTEEQKRQMLGDAYPRHQLKMQQEEAQRLAAEEAARKRLQQEMELQQFQAASRRTEGLVLAIILLASLLSWLGGGYVLHGLI